MPFLGNVPSSFNVDTNNINNGAITTEKIADGAVVNADVSASAAIAGTKISPDFGSQNIATTGLFSHALGTAGAPTITFTGDVNTGIYSPGADQVAISTGGSGRLFIDSSGRIGVGTSSPVGNLHINSGNTSDRVIYIQGSTYGLRLGATSGGGQVDGVDAINGSTSYQPLQLGGSALNLFTNGSERARMDSSGRLGIGTTSPRFDLSIGSITSTPTATPNTFDLGGTYSSTLGANPKLRLYWDGSTVYGLGVSSTGDAQLDYIAGTGASHVWYIGSTERMRINSSGAVGIGSASPQHILHLSSSSSSNYLRIDGSASRSYFGYETKGTVIYAQDQNGNASPLSFNIGGNEAGRFDTSSRLLLGTSSSSTSYGGGVSTLFQVAGGTSNSSTYPGISCSAYSTANSWGTISITKSNSNTVGVQTAVGADNRLGELTFEGSNGTSYKIGASIYAANDQASAWGASDCPTRLVFSTTADGAAGPTERMRIDSSGRVGIGTTSPGTYGAFAVRIASGGTSGHFSDGATGSLYIDHASNIISLRADTSNLAFQTLSTERARIDSLGRLLVGTSSVIGTNLRDSWYAIATFKGRPDTNTEEGRIALVRGEGSTSVSSGEPIGNIFFADNDGGTYAAIYSACDGTTGSGDCPGRLSFWTTADGNFQPTERMRIEKAGSVGIGTVNTTTDSYLNVITSSAPVAYFNRTTNDGTIIQFRQDSVDEGSISVSGNTVTLNGAHLSRWSQLPSVDNHDKSVRPEILRGTVMSNLDEMCEWINPTSGDAQTNPQLNKTKISDVEGDKNVAGIFQSWDDDDDTWVNDYYLAMTGDFIIRIAEGVTVERGDLLMSAGDGTAKPQDDDIIRSKTIAKVTSTNVSCTYDDGSYCVPCVLMAC